MKVHISRFSPHQNAKVVAVLMALGSLVFLIPVFVVFSLVTPAVDAHGNPVSGPPAVMFLLFPLAYLMMGYVFVRVGCWLYNRMFKYLGGFEYETEANDA